METVVKEDRRIRKTKKALREGLAELLNEKSIQNITVKELTDKVDIHRSTFYANFKDVYDLCNHMEDTILQEISDIILIDCSFDPVLLFKGVLGYISDNRQIARLFFGRSISTSFYDRLTTLLKNSCIDCLCNEYNVTEISEEMDYYVQFYFTGSLGVIGMWVAKDFNYSTEKLALMLAGIDTEFMKSFRVQ